MKQHGQVYFQDNKSKWSEKVRLAYDKQKYKSGKVHNIGATR